MNRASWTETWARFALAMAQRSRCDRAKIGAVIVSPQNRVVATGYNGPPRRWRPNGRILTDNCTDWCWRANHPSDLDPDYRDCPANHAEINALMHSSRTDREDGTIYVTGHVCMTCAKAIANSGLERVILVNVDPDVLHRRPQTVQEFLERCAVQVIEMRIDATT